MSVGLAVWAPVTAQEAEIIRERFTNANEAYRNKDFSRAYYWWNLLAEAGHAKAQSNLALLFLRGQGVEKNEDLALQWLDKAASQGVSTAQYNLGYLYSILKGKIRDEQKASFWYLKAAEHGHPTARFHLAQRYEQGLGTKRNYVEALRWTILAGKIAKSEKLKARIVEFKDELLDKMPRSQIRKVTQLAEATKGN
tara:strand:+ start:791 stop:1378 length:588 start_codon:yes stop_codon:yes gene_type:complete